MKIIDSALTLVMVLGGSTAAQHPSMPAGMSHDEHLRAMAKDKALKERGALAMGFDQNKVAHHFLLNASGATIAVTIRDSTDRESRLQVRSHLREITAAFAKGEFGKPVETHAELPPGTATMTTNRHLITYRYNERVDGAEVVISSSDAATLAAIHEFFRYQIVEHKTGDPLTVSPKVRGARSGGPPGHDRSFQQVGAPSAAGLLQLDVPIANHR